MRNSEVNLRPEKKSSNADKGPNALNSTKTAGPSANRYRPESFFQNRCYNTNSYNRNPANPSNSSSNPQTTNNQNLSSDGRNVNFARGTFKPNNNPQYNYSPTWDDYDRQNQENWTNKTFENFYLRRYGGKPVDGELKDDHTKDPPCSQGVGSKSVSFKSKIETLCPLYSQDTPSLSRHSIVDCETFKLMDPKEQAYFVRSRKLCYGCLKKGHMAKDFKT